MAKLGMLGAGAKPDMANRVAEGVFAGTVGLLNGATNLLATKTRHALGGTTPTYHVGGNNHSTVGPYKKIGMDLVEALGSTAIYSLARAGMVSGLGEPSRTPAGYTEAFVAAMGIAMVSALVTGIVKETILAVAADRTITRNNAGQAAELPRTEHNRSFEHGAIMPGVTLNEVKNPLNNLTLGGMKFKALATDVLSGLVGAAGLWAVNDSMRNAEPSDFGVQFGKVAASFAVFFALLAATKAIATFAGQHPGEHANAFARSSEEILVKELQASSMGELKEALSELGHTLRNGPADNPMRQDFELARLAVGGEPLRTGDGDAFARMADRLDQLAQPFLAPGQDATREDREMAQALVGAARSFRTANDFIEYVNDRPVEEGVLPTSVPETFLIDAQRKLYDAMAVMVSTTHTGTGGGEAAEFPSRQAIEKFAPLLPILAALRNEETRPDFSNLMSDLAEVKPNDADRNKKFGGLLASTDPASSRLHDRLADGGLLGISPKGIVDYARWSQQGAAALHDQITLAMDNIKSPDKFAQARAAIIQNLSSPFNYANTDPALNDAVLERPRELVRGVRDYLGRHEAEVAGQKHLLMQEFLEGGIHAKALAQAIRETMAEMNQPGNPRTGDELRKALGPAAVDVLLQTFPATEAALPDGGELLGRVLEAIGASLAHMDGDQKAVFDAAAKINPVFGQALLEVIHQNDAHYHPSNYNGVVNSLILLADHMQAHGIDHSNAAGIPSQLAHKTDVTQYYAGVSPEGSAMRFMKGMLGLTLQDPNMGLRYRSHDEALASEYASTIGTENDLSTTIGMSITGLDVTDGPYIAEAIDQKMMAMPGVYKSAGELTLIKEVVTKLQQEAPKIDSAATKELFHALAERGLPLVLHCDRGTPHDKNKYADDVIGIISDVVKEVHGENALHRPDELADKLRDQDGDLPPDFEPRQVKICWAHAAGVSRFTAESPDHTRDLGAILSRPELQGHLFVDLSWDFVGHDILQNTEDLLLKSAQTPQEKQGMVRLAQAMDGMIKSYKTFAQVGAQADKAQDLGDFALSAVHRLTGSRIAQHHLNQVAEFKHTVADVLSENPAVRDRLLDLVQNHGDNGNNWLNLLFQHSDKVMFGTDALAIGTKAHGEAAYAINTKVLYPVYHIFQALADNVERNDIQSQAHAAADPEELAEEGAVPFHTQLRDVVANVARRTYQNFFQDPAMERRREQHEDMLLNRGPDFPAGPPAERIHPAGDLLGQARAQMDASDAQAGGTALRPSLTQPVQRRGAASGTNAAETSAQGAGGSSLAESSAQGARRVVSPAGSSIPESSAQGAGRMAPRTPSLVEYLKSTPGGQALMEGRESEGASGARTSQVEPRFPSLMDHLNSSARRNKPGASVRPPAADAGLGLFRPNTGSGPGVDACC
jgi:hypothetical protein